MPAYVSIKVLPFEVPSTLRLEPVDGESSRVLPLTALSATSLSDMCDDFRAEVFKKAGKADFKMLLRR